MNYSFRTNMSDAEVDAGFQIAKALGVDKITASSNVDTAARIYPAAEKYKIAVGMHNHDSMLENEFSTPGDFSKAMRGRPDILRSTSISDTSPRRVSTPWSSLKNTTRTS